MDCAQIVMPATSTVEIQHTTIPDQPAPGQILIASEWSVISAGTEVANYTAKDGGVHVPGNWNSYPWTAGYGNVGIVRAVGSGVAGITPGQRVFTHGPHASCFHYGAERLVVPVPDAVDPALAAASRMAGVAFTGPLAAELGANQWVAVFGLGMVGNLAAQICRLLGARVIGIDPSATRRAQAQRCGIAHV
ncbi:MAG: hypothetical protein H0W72_17160, partial [Planctomycetes bacterium]|nr:hypothetical protein [Planctomycetota bacterium]